MRKVKCDKCSYVFDPEDAPMKSEVVESKDGFVLWNDYTVCPECGSSDLEEFTQLSEDCNGIDCYADCENCEIKAELDRAEAEEASKVADDLHNRLMTGNFFPNHCRPVKSKPIEWEGGENETN